MKDGIILILLAVVLAASLLWEAPPTVAQQRPYQAYPVRGGCLYITAQGYAVFTDFTCGGQ
jgi:hypothetical protein